jgi:hypothetical protein
MPAPHIVVKFDRESLAALYVALMAKPSWLDAEKVHEELYDLVDTLMIHGVDQKRFSNFALIKGAEEMVTTQEIRAVSWCSSFFVSAVLF